ncbi:hypothetical protein ACK8GE_13270 [Micromonosporaceae bacterium DT194]|uniref:hypothetical protein n=1 Tax=Melissospora conviva TaxID=3388432 RepID=UPI003C1D3C1C
MKNIFRGIGVGVAGLAFASGVVAGPAVPVFAQAAEVAQPSTVAVAQVRAGPDHAALATSVQGKQSRIDLSAEQQENAKAIVAATKGSGMNERAAVIAVATAMQESKLENLGHLGAANDHDSQGLFQQRPSSGWGTVEQIRDPQYSTTAFLDSLDEVEGWEQMDLTDAAQKVQVSAYPDAYAQWETQAAELVAQHW